MSAAPELSSEQSGVNTAYADQANPPPAEEILGDCREVLKGIRDQFVNCCVTSPPYLGLRDYGNADQIGLEKTPEQYVSELVSVFQQVRRVLRNDGTLRLNLGDTDIGKSLAGIPWKVAFALQADGWHLQQDIIWHKPNPIPESVRDRCTKAHEYLFLLSRIRRYYFDHRAMQEPATKGAAGSEFHTGKTGLHQLGRASSKPRTAGNKSHKYVSAYENSSTDEHRTKADLMNVADVAWETRNRRSVWSIATKAFREAHFATFPPALVQPCVFAGCPEYGTVLDPFLGARTTALVAEQNDRSCIEIELNPDYLSIARLRLSAEIERQNAELKQATNDLFFSRQ